MSGSADILFVTSTLEVGGSETKIVRIANALAKAGHSVAIAFLNPPDSLLDSIDAKVQVMPLDRRGKFSFGSLQSLRRIAGRSNQVAFAVNFYPLLYMLPAIRLNGGRARTVGLINTTEFVGGQWYWGQLYAPFLRRCDRLVYGCRFQQEMWTQRYRLPGERSSYIYNGVDAEQFSPDGNAERSSEFRAQHGIPADAIVMGGIGRLAPEKDFARLIEALSRLDATGRPGWLLLVGEGAERAKLERAASDGGLRDRALFPGVLKDVRPALAAMDVFVLPSRSETFSNAALEAMALARPVVLSNIGGAPEMIVQRESGYLFDAGDVDELTRILSELYDSMSLREHIGAAARQHVVEAFGFERMIAGYEGLVASLHH